MCLLVANLLECPTCRNSISRQCVWTWFGLQCSQSRISSLSFWSSLPSLPGKDDTCWLGNSGSCNPHILKLPNSGKHWPIWQHVAEWLYCKHMDIALMSQLGLQHMKNIYNSVVFCRLNANCVFPNTVFLEKRRQSVIGSDSNGSQ